MQITETLIDSGRSRRIAKACARMLGGFIFLLATSWILDRHSLRVESDAYLFSWGFFAGILPLLVLYGLLLSITNRTFLSILLGIALLALLFVANAKKIEYLHATVVPTDYFFLKSLDGSSLALLGHYINVPTLIAVAVASALVVAILIRYERPVLYSRPILRSLILLGSLALGWMLISGGRVADRIYNANDLGASYSSLISELHSGLLSSLISANLADQRAMKVSPDPGAVATLLKATHARFPNTYATNTSRPDIVIVQSESFFDPSTFQDTFAEGILPNLHRAQKEGGSSSMSVPTFGGGTLRTEFEVLTGIPLEAYPDLQFPYLQISQPRIESVVTTLNEVGYSTIAIHPNSGEFWNRRVAYQSIGFQKFLTVKEFPSSAYRDGLYISDHSMTSQIMESLERAQGPSLIFAVSIEAHGPYRHVPVRDGAERDALPVRSSWPEKATDEFRTYSYHIRHADSELGRLWDYLKKRNRPFLLVFYGDHLPGFEYVYQASKFQNGLPAYQQNVPLVLIDSSGAAGPRTPEHMYSWMLGDEILRRAGIHESGYLRFVGNVGRMLDTDNGGPSDPMRAGLQSAARMRLTGQFDAFYRSHSSAN